MSKFYLPDLGEGLQSAEIVEWKIKAGDKVKTDQLILVVETAKAIVEIPSPVEAHIEKINFVAGDSVDVGAALMEYQEAGASEEGLAEEGASVTGEGVSVTAEPKSVSVVGRLETASADERVDSGDEILVDEAEESLVSSSREVSSFNAPPSVKLFAGKLGISDVLSEENYGEVGEASLLATYNEKKSSSRNQQQNDSVMRLKGARKVMAQTMSRSHEQIPSVTLFDDANISAWAESEDITLRCIDAIVRACHVEPILNAWFDEESMSIQLFQDINLGVAVNSDEGLFVPVIRKAQTLTSSRIRDILTKQIGAIKDRSIKPQKLLGATISLSNFGSLSGRYATPIIVPPQVAIVGIGKIREEPVVSEGKIGVGKVLPISLSFDHRAASGAEAARFMQAIIDSLSKE
jgi:pyruvate dehydrogenase E2 component (dihydrolipoamide acetyltransferase)